jgi:hypothetical protein
MTLAVKIQKTTMKCTTKPKFKICALVMRDFYREEKQCMETEVPNAVNNKNVHEKHCKRTASYLGQRSLNTSSTSGSLSMYKDPPNSWSHWRWNKPKVQGAFQFPLKSLVILTSEPTLTSILKLQGGVWQKSKQLLLRILKISKYKVIIITALQINVPCCPIKIQHSKIMTFRTVSLAPTSGKTGRSCLLAISLDHNVWLNFSGYKVTVAIQMEEPSPVLIWRQSVICSWSNTPIKGIQRKLFCKKTKSL